ncbi:MAG: anti-sigma factor [Acidimicrobiia bacterium]|nr:anti-sigma factor [Acidimicrobiia bacterium]
MPDRELQEWTALSRSISEQDRVRHTPPPGLFDLITSEIADLEETSPDVVINTAPAPEPEPVIDLTHERTRRAPAAERQRRRQMFLVSIAAACVLVVGFTLFGGGDATETFVAEATNNSLPEAFDGVATATLTGGDGWTLSLDFSDVLPDDEPVELWAIKPDLSDMVSLGIVEPGTSEFVWPTGFPPTEYSLVDLSIEPNDGNPAHSGRSILRGELRSV